MQGCRVCFFSAEDVRGEYVCMNIQSKYHLKKIEDLKGCKNHERDIMKSRRLKEVLTAYKNPTKSKEIG